jgi:hypothetical protein
MIEARQEDSVVSSFVYAIEDAGFWLYHQRELYWVDFGLFPIFLRASDEEIFDFELDGSSLHWPALDADIELDSLLHPDRYSLCALHSRERSGAPFRR